MRIFYSLFLIVALLPTACGTPPECTENCEAPNTNHTTENNSSDPNTNNDDSTPNQPADNNNGQTLLKDISEAEIHALCTDAATIEEKTEDCGNDTEVTVGGVDVDECIDDFPMVNDSCTATVEQFRECFYVEEPCDVFNHPSCGPVFDCIFDEN